jgi:hypothetical protein
MNKNLAPFYQKTLALIILILGIFCINSLLIQPLNTLFMDKKDDVQKLEERILRYQNIITHEENYKSQLKKRSNVTLPDLFYHGNSAAVLNAEIQSDLRRLIGRDLALIENIQSVKLSPKDGVMRVGVRMSLRADMASLVKILKKLKNHNRHLNIENVSFRTSEYQATTRAPQINIRWDVVGFGVIDQNSARPLP